MRACQLLPTNLPSFGSQALHAHGVVDRALLRIVQDVVGFLHLNEQIHRQLFIARIDVFVRMVEERESTVRLLESSRVCLKETLDAEST